VQTEESGGTRVGPPAPPFLLVLLLLRDALEWRLIGLYVHDATGGPVTLDVVAARSDELRAAFYRAPTSGPLRWIRCQVVHLLPLPDLRLLPQGSSGMLADGSDGKPREDHSR